MKRNFFMSVVVISFVLFGCAPQKSVTAKTQPDYPLYYWGNYSQALYKYKKDQTPESFEQYKKALANIVEISDKRRLAVPPGIYAEYALILAKEGKIERARAYLYLEKAKYPESRIFVDRLMNAIGEKGGSL